jgi:hypothetical protein
MQRRSWAVAVGLMLGIALPASAEIVKGTLAIRGAEMS